MGIRLSKVSGFKYHGYNTYFWIKTKFGSRSMQIGSGTFRSRTKSLYVFQPSSIKTDPRSNPPWFLPGSDPFASFPEAHSKTVLEIAICSSKQNFWMWWLYINCWRVTQANLAEIHFTHLFMTKICFNDWKGMATTTHLEVWFSIVFSKEISQTALNAHFMYWAPWITQNNNLIGNIPLLPPTDVNPFV